MANLCQRIIARLPEQDKALRSALLDAMTSLSKEVGHLNPMYSCTVLPTGSAVEQTQVDTSDFDYIMKLDYFEREGVSKVALTKKGCKPGEGKLKLTDADAQVWGDHSRQLQNGSYLSTNIKYQLHTLFKQAYERVGDKLNTKLHLIPDYHTNMQAPLKQMASPSHVLAFTWEEATQSRIILVDLVVGVYIGKMGDGVSQDLSILRSYPTPELDDIMTGVLDIDLYTVGRFDYLWRISWGEAELKLMQHINRVTPGANICYRIVKYLCKTCFTTSVADSYVLKNILFRMWIDSYGQPSAWKEQVLEANVVEMLHRLCGAYQRGYHSFFARAVTILNPSDWHTSNALPALRELIRRIQAHEDIDTMLKMKIFCKPLHHN